ncbi:hypothetical protein CPB85DRAFT_397385 [Mucidula mucida]|nr:hypothetical protein CPB85DRAFT_397385 [Mucidula mucida]
MPLILSPESTCDICSRQYADDIVVPHVVSCGHVFCKTCLTTHFSQDNAANPQCPYCRKHFSIPDTNLPYDKRFGKVVKRLFVHYESAYSEQTLLAELALSLRPSSSDDSLAQLDAKITHWLENHEDHVRLHPGSWIRVLLERYSGHIERSTYRSHQASIHRKAMGADGWCRWEDA